MPIGVKDLLSATEGVPTAHGSAGFGDWVADHDSTHVRRLREAGAIVVGKTATPELGLRPVTESARYGVTRNPWSPGLAAGGSSGGSAAAVAAGMVALADGSDLGGSIRIPASCCGVIGFKPSRGRVSIGPDFGDLGGGAPADGPLARSVLDVALALDAMSGYEPGDHHWLEPCSFAAAAERAPGPLPVRLALSAPLGVPVDVEPRAAARQAAALLAEHALEFHVALGDLEIGVADARHRDANQSLVGKRLGRRDIAQCGIACLEAQCFHRVLNHAEVACSCARSRRINR